MRLSTPLLPPPQLNGSLATSLNDSVQMDSSPLTRDQRTCIGAMLDYAAAKDPRMQLEFGSCFEDRLAVRPYETVQYNPEFFEHDGIVKGDEFGISIYSDITGGITETSRMEQGRQLGQDINIRRREGDATKAAFPRKPGEAVFSVDRPGSLYVVPSRFQTAIECHHAHVSYYEKRKRDIDFNSEFFSS